MPSPPGLRRAWRPGLPWASMCRPPGFCRFAAVYVSPSGLLPLRGCCGRGGLGGRCGRRLMCVVLAAQRASNIKALGERSEALGEAYNNFEPRQG